MKRSSKMVPFFICISLILFVCAIVIICDYSDKSIRSFDVFGISDIKTMYSEQEENSEITDISNTDSTTTEEQGETPYEEDSVDFTEELVENMTEKTEAITNAGDEASQKENVSTENDEPEETESVNTEIPENVADGVSYDLHEKSDNEVAELNMLYSASIGEEAMKIDFYTTDLECDYRVFIKTKINDNPIDGTFYLTMYDERGIMVGEKKIFHPTYGNTSYYRDEFFVDYYLDKSKKYTLKLENSAEGGDFQIGVVQLEREAGVNKANATPISAGYEVTAVINSSLSDWYVCNFDEVGKYQITLHNIDVGDQIKINGWYEDNTNLLFSLYAKNESNDIYSFSINRAGKVYIQVSPDFDQDYDTHSGTYIMTINKIGN